MKSYVFLSVLLLSTLAVSAVFAQEFEPEDMEFQMEMQQQKMDMEHRQAKMDMERKMQELDLQQRRMELERALHDYDDDDDDNDEREGLLGLLLGICVIVRILLAVWVYMDIRQLGRGSGIWIVIVLLAGLLGALVYAVVRIGDNKQKS